MSFKRIKSLLTDLIYVFLYLTIAFMIILLNAVFIANIANSLRMTGYIDPTFGIQVILVMVSLVWAPLTILVKHIRQ